MTTVAPVAVRDLSDLTAADLRQVGAAEEARRAVLSLYGDLDDEEWAAFLRGADRPGPG